MHMVRDAANGFRHTFNISHYTAEIGVQPFAPCGGDNWRTIFGAKDDVVMKREMGGGHGLEVPAPLPGRMAFLSAIRWLTPPANFRQAFGFERIAVAERVSRALEEPGAYFGR